MVIHHFGSLSCEDSKYEITLSAALQPEAIDLPTDNPPLWLPTKFSPYKQNNLKYKYLSNTSLFIFLFQARLCRKMESLGCVNIL